MTVDEIKSLSDPIKPIENSELDQLAQVVVEAHRSKKQVVLSMGAHPLRCGNSRYIINLMRLGVITHIATNGAVAIHDFELATNGNTLEDVEVNIADGSFGNWQETGYFMNSAASIAAGKDQGFGETIGKLLLHTTHSDISIFAAGFRHRIPVTVHKGIGYDITDQYPYVDFRALGQASGTDFDIFAYSISKLQEGVFICAGAQVMGPEVYLKALSMARNVASQSGQKINQFSTAVFDIVDLGDWRNEKDIVNYKKPGAMQDPRYYYRPMKSILIRTVKDGGQSFYIQGDFKDTIPALYQRILSLL